MYKFIKPKIISHVRKWYCSFELSQVVYKNFWINGCPQMQQSGELSELFVTLGFPISNFSLCVHTPHSCVHPRFAEQNNIRILYLFLPRFTLESISYSVNIRVSRRISSQRYAVSRDETTCASLHLKKKIRWRAFFRIYSLERIGDQVVILHWILSFSCNINTNEFCFRHLAFVILEHRFPVCMFGNTIFCME